MKCGCFKIESFSRVALLSLLLVSCLGMSLDVRAQQESVRCVDVATQAAKVKSASLSGARPNANLAMPNLKVSAVQYAIRQNQSLDQFLARTETFVREAKQNNVNLVVFPELVTLDLIQTNNAASYEQQLNVIARDVTDVYVRRMQALAQELDISILAGTSPRIVNGQVYNTAFLLMADGSIVMQDKIFMTPDEIEWRWTPGTGLYVFNAPWGKTVILICFDCEFPLLSNLLAAEKPELILVPSMTGDAHGLARVQWSAQARAIEHYAYIVHTGTVQHPGAEEAHHGQASIITPREPGFQGLVNRGEENIEASVIGEIDMAYLRNRRMNNARVYPAREQVNRPPDVPIAVIRD